MLKCKRQVLNTFIVLKWPFFAMQMTITLCRLKPNSRGDFNEGNMSVQTVADRDQMFKDILRKI